MRLLSGMAAASLAAVAMAGSKDINREAIAANLRPQFGADRVVHVPHEAVTEEAARLLSGVGADRFGRTETGATFRLRPHAVEQLQNMGVVFDDLTESWLDDHERLLQQGAAFCEDDASVCATSPDFYKIYQPLDSLLYRIHLLMEATPHSKMSQGSIGKTYEGRDTPIFFLGQDPAKKTVWINCNIHAREWLTPVFCVHLMEQLTTNSSMLDLFNFVVIPSVNQDGYVFTMTTNPAWRKSRKPNANQTNPDCQGTDLNRNFDDHWGDLNGASNDPCSETYFGLAPFDNVETANVRDAANAYVAANGTIVLFVDVHTFGPYILSPPGYSFDLPPNFNQLSKCMVLAHDAAQDATGIDFTIGTTARQLYVATGGTDDWFFDAMSAPLAYTYELRGPTFQPPPENIVVSNREALAALTAMTSCADGFFNTHTSPPVTAPVGAPTPIPDCFDRNPSYLVYPNGGAAACGDLRTLCFVNDDVRARCPQTCNQCWPGYQDTVPSGVLPTVRVDLAEAPGNTLPGDGLDTVKVAVTALILLVVGVLFGVCAAALVLRKTGGAASSDSTAVKNYSEGM